MPGVGAKRLFESWDERWVVTALVLLLLLPFLFQPFHIDDRIYLEIADNTLSQPLYPYDYAPVFEGLVTPDAASHSHLPLISYYLALLKWLAGGEPEWLFHLAFLIFPLLAAWGFLDLARRFTRFPLAAACMLIASPGVLVLSHTLMTDVPLMAFWIVAVSRFVAILEGETDKKNWIVTALALGAAAAVSVITAGLVLLLVVLAGFYWKTLDPRLRWKLILLALAPLTIWLAWYVRGYLHYDRFLLIRTVLHADKREAFSAAVLGQKLLSLWLNLGGAFICPWVLWYSWGRKRSLWFLIPLVAAPFVGPLLAPSWTGTQSFLWMLMAVAGTLTAAGLISLAWRWRMVQAPAPSPLAWLLLLWWAGICTAAILLYPSGSVRYVLPLTPALILLWLHVLEEKVAFSQYFLRNLVWMGVALTLIYSLPLAYADYRFARMYQQDTQQLVQDYARPGRTIWFTGEWGFRYYMQRYGGRLLPRTALGPEPGDVIIKPRVAFPWVTLYDGPEYTRLLEQRPASLRLPIRLLDFESHAGFYSTAWGILPWSWAESDTRWEWFNVFEVVKPYDGPIPKSDRHW